MGCFMDTTSHAAIPPPEGPAKNPESAVCKFSGQPV